MSMRDWSRCGSAIDGDFSAELPHWSLRVEAEDASAELSMHYGPSRASPLEPPPLQH